MPGGQPRRSGPRSQASAVVRGTRATAPGAYRVERERGAPTILPPAAAPAGGGPSAGIMAFNDGASGGDIVSADYVGDGASVFTFSPTDDFLIVTVGGWYSASLVARFADADPTHYVTISAAEFPDSPTISTPADSSQDLCVTAPTWFFPAGAYIQFLTSGALRFFATVTLLGA